jgi:hypothetical protein
MTADRGLVWGVCAETQFKNESVPITEQNMIIKMIQFDFLLIASSELVGELVRRYFITTIIISMESICIEKLKNYGRNYYYRPNSAWESLHSHGGMIEAT